MTGPIRRPVSVLALDFDGLLVDSLAAKAAAWDDVFALYPHDARTELAKLRRENPSENRVEFISRCVSVHRGGRDEGEEHGDVMMRRLSEAMIHRVGSCPAIAGAERLLAFGERLPLYIISLTPLADLEKIVERRGMGRFVRGLFGNPPWTKERALEEIAARGSIPPEEILFAGDAVSDAVAARNAGVQFAGAGSDEALKKTGAVIAPDLEILCDWLDAALAGPSTPF